MIVYAFSNCGMSYLVGSHWRDYFDVVIVQARKPKFFTDETRPIRLYDEKTRSHLWDRVFKLEKGKIYYEVGAVAITDSIEMRRFVDSVHN